MIIAVVATEEQQKELVAKNVSDALQMVWLTEPAAVEGAQAYINLRAEEQWHDGVIPDYLPSLTIVNAVTTGANDWPSHFIRINGWPGFLQGSTIEATGGDASTREAASRLMQQFNRQLEWVSDQPGFIGARIVCAIINEAYLALQEKVSSKEDIDTAMKLGTNYPMGPFAWANAIGIKNVYALLGKLAVEHPRYTPAMRLKEEAEK